MSNPVPLCNLRDVELCRKNLIVRKKIVLSNDKSTDSGKETFGSGTESAARAVFVVCSGLSLMKCPGLSD